jgi:hypothetical protein
VSLLLWTIIVTDAVRQGLTLTTEATISGLRFDGTGIFIVAVPILFFSIAPMWMKGHPFDVKLVREWVNRKFGSETYEDYTRTIRPLALLATAGFVMGTTAIANAVRVNADQSAFVLGGFFISTAVGFLACRSILRKQGDRIE